MVLNVSEWDTTDTYAEYRLGLHALDTLFSFLLAILHLSLHFAYVRSQTVDLLIEFRFDLGSAVAPIMYPRLLDFAEQCPLAPWQHTAVA